MTNKRYSIFLSSTFEDLKKERQSVQDVVISSGDFPVQMESFPATDQDQFEFIKSLIDKCDYYILIIAGRYGTPASDGISYTEKEYRYAVEKGIPVLAMIHANPENIAVGKSEKSEEGKARLKAFISEVETKRLRKTWNSPDELKLVVREALEHAKATKPAIGWIRGDTSTSLEALEELNAIRKENAQLRELIGASEVELALPPIPEAGDSIFIDVLANSKMGGYGSNTPDGSATIQTSWISIFPIFHKNLEWHSTDYDNEFSYWIEDENSCVEIGSAIAGELIGADTSKCFILRVLRKPNLMA